MRLIIIFFTCFLTHRVYCVKPVLAPRPSVSTRPLKESEQLTVTSTNYGKPDGKYDPDEDNYLIFKGEGNCQPQISCPELDIQPQCDLEYVMISDEKFSYRVMCGAKPMKGWLKVSGKTLQLRFRTSSKPPTEHKKGLKCLVQCAPPVPCAPPAAGAGEGAAEGAGAGEPAGGGPPEPGGPPKPDGPAEPAGPPKPDGPAEPAGPPKPGGPATPPGARKKKPAAGARKKG